MSSGRQDLARQVSFDSKTKPHGEEEQHDDHYRSSRRRSSDSGSASTSSSSSDTDSSKERYRRRTSPKSSPRSSKKDYDYDRKSKSKHEKSPSKHKSSLRRGPGLEDQQQNGLHASPGYYGPGSLAVHPQGLVFTGPGMQAQMPAPEAIMQIPQYGQPMQMAYPQTHSTSASPARQYPESRMHGPAPPLILGPSSPTSYQAGPSAAYSYQQQMSPVRGGRMPAGASATTSSAQLVSQPHTLPPPGAYTTAQQPMMMQQQQVPITMTMAGGIPPPMQTSGGLVSASGEQMTMLFDATTHEVIMADLRMVKELQRQGHVLVNVDEAYRQQIAQLQSMVNGALMGKREQLMQQHARLSTRISEVSATRVQLERDVAVLADEMTGRLRSCESLKLALLQREQSEISRDLDALQSLVHEVSEVSGAGVVPFLNACTPLMDSCNRLVSKPFKAEVDVGVDDMPAEARVYRELAEAHAALTKLLAVKDQMISHLLAERSTLQAEMQSLSEKYASELEALDRQAQTYFDQLQALQQQQAADRN